MVRHNPRRPKTNAGTQIPALKPLSLMEDPAAKQSPPPHAELFTAQLGFPDRVYLLAAAIFQNNHQEKPASHRLVNYGKQEGSALPQVKEGGMDLAAYDSKQQKAHSKLHRGPTALSPAHAIDAEIR
ncbi:unnamed protein product [Lota lota]